MKILAEKHSRKSDGDVFLAQKLKNANFKTGFYQVPEIDDVELDKPKDLVLWSNRTRCKNKSECGLIFYEYDSNFDGIDGIYIILKYGSDEEVNSLIAELKDFAFVVCPDYSVYGNFPNYKQIDAIAKVEKLGIFFQLMVLKLLLISEQPMNGHMS